MPKSLLFCTEAFSPWKSPSACLLTTVLLQACLLLDTLFPIVCTLSKEQKDCHYHCFQGRRQTCWWGCQCCSSPQNAIPPGLLCICVG